ncbi:hypothetical protein GLX30_24735 [Streptomyces sp. Tu 2975]|uniref:hypothetical protein n=1 Tax=Streptomyces sp. Tu 2975 TaxID=2676871 RepID=UPI0013591A68|nr:hypothetical protein [Streptomyces sp. Tu 2975]QIP86694.1 hypothetical protein GLX30_24735 [Streptomyces sp. Tu 2975]
MEIAQVIFSGVLVLVTLAYVILTWRLAGHTSRTADSAKESATASLRAAEAAARSATVMEAGLAVEFHIAIRRHASSGFVRFNTKPTTASVYLHKLTADLNVMPDETGKQIDVPPFDLQPEDGQPLPLFAHCGDAAAFEWPHPTARVGDFGIWGHVIVQYSLSEDAPTRSRSVLVESREGLHDLAARLADGVQANDQNVVDNLSGDGERHGVQAADG